MARTGVTRPPPAEPGWRTGSTRRAGGRAVSSSRAQGPVGIRLPSALLPALASELSPWGQAEVPSAAKPRGPQKRAPHRQCRPRWQPSIALIVRARASKPTENTCQRRRAPSPRIPLIRALVCLVAHLIPLGLPTGTKTGAIGGPVLLSTRCPGRRELPLEQPVTSRRRGKAVRQLGCRTGCALAACQSMFAHSRSLACFANCAARAKSQVLNGHAVVVRSATKLENWVAPAARPAGTAASPASLSCSLGFGSPCSDAEDFPDEFGVLSRSLAQPACLQPALEETEAEADLRNTWQGVL